MTIITEGQDLGHPTGLITEGTDPGQETEDQGQSILDPILEGHGHELDLWGQGLDLQLDLRGHIHDHQVDLRGHGHEVDTTGHSLQLNLRDYGHLREHSHQLNQRGQCHHIYPIDPGQGQCLHLKATHIQERFPMSRIKQ